MTFGTLINHSRGELFDPDPQDADASTGKKRTARCSRMSATGSAPGSIRSAGEDMHQAVNRECKTVRDVAGIFDASTLGKIEVVGPDAAEFLNLIYTNSLGYAEARPLPLRHHAARGRLRL